MPLQPNGTDCGVYVIKFVQQFALLLSREHFDLAFQIRNRFASVFVTRPFKFGERHVSDLRRSIRKIVDTLHAKYQTAGGGGGNGKTETVGVDAEAADAETEAKAEDAQVVAGENVGAAEAEDVAGATGVEVEEEESEVLGEDHGDSTSGPKTAETVEGESDDGNNGDEDDEKGEDDHTELEKQTDTESDVHGEDGDSSDNDSDGKSQNEDAGAADCDGGASVGAIDSANAGGSDLVSSSLSSARNGHADKLVSRENALGHLLDEECLFDEDDKDLQRNKSMHEAVVHYL